MISLIDHNVGRILIALEEAGLAEDTVVIYTTDHGDWLGDHGLVLKGPMHYEGLLRVGMIVRGPDVPAGQVVHEPVSTLDITATFCDYAQTTPLLTQHGQSLRPLIELAHDPHEMENLFDKPDSVAIQQELMAMIEQRPDDMRPIQTPVGAA